MNCKTWNIKLIINLAKNTEAVCEKQTPLLKILLLPQERRGQAAVRCC